MSFDPSAACEPGRVTSAMAAMAAMADVMATLDALPPMVERLPESELNLMFASLMRTRAVAEGAALAVLIEARERGVIDRSDLAGAAAWVTNTAATQNVAVTPALASSFAAVCRESTRVCNAPVIDAARAGHIAAGEAKVVLRELRGLRHEVPAELWDVAAQALTDYCADGAGSRQIVEAREAIVASYGDREAFDDRVRAQRAVRSFGDFRRDRAGMHVATLRLDADSYAVLDAAVNALAAPGPTAAGVDAHPRHGGHAGNDVSVGSNGAGGLFSASDTGEGRDDRDRATRRADAIVEMAACVGTDPSQLADIRPTSAARSQLVLTMSRADFEQMTGYATTEQRQPIPPSSVRGHACGADIVPALVDEQGHVLDVGRRFRYATARQVTALRLRDKGCGFPGCDRPPSWCEAHHILPWSLGGPTDLGNLTLLCSRHHTIVHTRGYTATVTVDGVVWHCRLADPLPDAPGNLRTGGSAVVRRWHDAPGHEEAHGLDARAPLFRRGSSAERDRRGGSDLSDERRCAGLSDSDEDGKSGEHRRNEHRRNDEQGRSDEPGRSDEHGSAPVRSVGGPPELPRRSDLEAATFPWRTVRIRLADLADHGAWHRILARPAAGPPDTDSCQAGPPHPGQPAAP